LELVTVEAQEVLEDLAVAVEHFHLVKALEEFRHQY
jgi:hypothetical protein